MKQPVLTDEYWMQLALELAAEGEGLTRPNPPVGAVVVNKGRMVGSGFHPGAGLPHAEIFALREAGAKTRGATLYITLEPCCTQGRTPPCTEAIMNAGIKRVVYGCVDPNPVHAGRANQLLEKVDIKVSSGILGNSCATMIRPFTTRILKNRPFVTLKLACSLDGRIADRTGISKWITGLAAREAVQDLRRSADGVMIGAETLRADDPSLRPRPAHGRNPWRVVIAGSNPLPIKAKLFNDPFAEHTIVFASPGFRQRHFLESKGVKVIEISSTRGNINLKKIMMELAELGCMHLVCEGGGILAEKLLRVGLVDQLWMFYAPILLGGDARPAVAGRGWPLSKAPGFIIKHVESLDRDVLVVAEKDHV